MKGIGLALRKTMFGKREFIETINE